MTNRSTLHIPVNANGFNVDHIEGAIKNLWANPHKPTVLRVPQTEGFRFNASHFDSTNTSENFIDSLNEMIDYGNTTDEAQTKVFPLPIGFLNIHLTIPNMEIRMDYRSNTPGEITYLNRCCVNPINKARNHFHETIEETPKGTFVKSTAIFSCKYTLLGIKPQGKSSNNDQLSLENKKLLQVLQVMNPNTEETEYDKDACEESQLIRELLYVLRLPTVQVKIDPKETKGSSMGRIKLIFSSIRQQIHEYNDNALKIVNHICEVDGKRFPDGFGYYTRPKEEETKSSPSGRVIYHKEITEDQYTIHPNLYTQERLTGFFKRTPSDEDIVTTMKAFLFTYGYGLNTNNIDGYEQSPTRNHNLAIPRSNTENNQRSSTGNHRFSDPNANTGRSKRYFQARSQSERTPGQAQPADNGEPIRGKAMTYGRGRGRGRG
jgi:hypothetical protein